MLVFVPLSFLSHHLDWDAALRFSFSFIAIMPLAKVTSRVFHRALMLLARCFQWLTDPVLVFVAFRGCY